ncbi:hypothetical protein GEMRC1_006076 [Eukaryota sp. GEM-RC1]
MDFLTVVSPDTKERLQKIPSGHDQIIVFNEEVISVNKAVLSLNSKYFHDWDSPAPLDLSDLDVSVDSLSDFISSFDNKPIYLKPNTCFDFFFLATYLQCTYLDSTLVATLPSHFSLFEWWISFMKSADKHGDGQGYELALEFAARSIDSVIDLPNEDPVYFSLTTVEHLIKYSKSPGSLKWTVECFVKLIDDIDVDDDDDRLDFIDILNLLHSKFPILTEFLWTSLLILPRIDNSNYVSLLLQSNFSLLTAGSLLNAEILPIIPNLSYILEKMPVHSQIPLNFKFSTEANHRTSDLEILNNRSAIFHKTRSTWQFAIGDQTLKRGNAYKWKIRYNNNCQGRRSIMAGIVSTSRFEQLMKREKSAKYHDFCCLGRNVFNRGPGDPDDHHSLLWQDNHVLEIVVDLIDDVMIVRNLDTSNQMEVALEERVLTDDLRPYFGSGLNNTIIEILGGKWEPSQIVVGYFLMCLCFILWCHVYSYCLLFC